MDNKKKRGRTCRVEPRYDNATDEFAPSDWIKPEGTPLPERICQDCQNYSGAWCQIGVIREGAKTVTHEVGPLWPACPRFVDEHGNTMEQHETKPTETQPKTKVCKRCGRELPLDAFSKTKTTYDGLQANCKECHREMNRNYNAKMRAYRKDAKEAEKAQKKVPMGYREAVSHFSEKVAEAVKNRVHIIEDYAVDQGVKHDALNYFNDSDLVNELRRRGYDVKCVKSVEL